MQQKITNAIRCKHFPTLYQLREGCGRKVVNICFSISIDVENSRITEEYQQNKTKWKVTSTPEEAVDAMALRPLLTPDVSVIQNLWAASATPCIIPQSTKIHERHTQAAQEHGNDEIGMADFPLPVLV